MLYSFSMTKMSAFLFFFFFSFERYSNGHRETLLVEFPVSLNLIWSDVAKKALSTSLFNAHCVFLFLLHSHLLLLCFFLEQQQFCLSFFFF